MSTVNHPTLPERIRAFIAIPIDPGVCEAITRMQHRLADSLAAGAVRWVSPGQIHLTLKFLGDIPLSILPKIEAVLDSVTASNPSIYLTAGGFGCFPDARDPKVLWVGLSGDVGPLKTLAWRIEEELSPGVSPEAREFHPHLTIGRVKSASAATRQALRAAMQAQEADSFGTWRGDRVELMRSELTPDGSRYTVLRAWPLATRSDERA